MENRLLNSGVIAIIRGVDAKDVEKTGRALAAGGVTCMEVTFDPRVEARDSNTSRCVQILQQALPDVLLGVGTVVRPDMVEEAKRLGAAFVVSPNTDVDIIQAARAHGMAALPGAYTPTEAMAAHNAGATAVKLFPAGSMGPGYVKAICEPLSHLTFFVVGGVTPENVAEYFAAGARGVGVGAILVDKKRIAAGDFDAITQKARQYTRAVENALKTH